MWSTWLNMTAAMPAEKGHVPMSRSPEIELLLCCARRVLAIEYQEKLRALLAGGLNWERVQGLARRHRLTHLLFHHLNQSAADLVPGSVLQSLREAFNRNARRSLLLSAELREVHALFADAGIAALAYKGPVLGQQVYGNVALREMSDLDVLVAPRDVIAARDLLIGRGYYSLPAAVGIPDRLALSWDCNLILFRDQPRQIFELHWALAAGRFTFPLPFAEAWNRRHEVLLSGARLPTFSTEDQLLILCFHGSRHMWECIEWITGVAELIRSEAVDWDELWRRAERLRSRHRLMLGLKLASDLLDAPVPAEVLRRSSAPPMAFDAVSKVLFNGSAPSTNASARPFHSFQVALSDGMRSKLRYMFYSAFEPAKEDYFALRLPSALYPLYPLIRPLRLARSYGARLVGGKP